MGAVASCLIWSSGGGGVVASCLIWSSGGEGQLLPLIV